MRFTDELTRGASSSKPPLLMEIAALDGVHRSVECQMAVVTDNEAQIAGVMVTARDVTLREKTIKALADSAALLTAILSTVPTR